MKQVSSNLIKVLNSNLVLNICNSVKLFRKVYRLFRSTVACRRYL